MFTRKLDPDELIPILNKPAAAPQPSAANEAMLGMERNLEENKNKRRLRRNVEPGHKCDLESKVPFKAFEHFIISKKSIRELCDVHIVFLEDFKKLPPFGISCLSHLDLWKDQTEANIQEFKQHDNPKQQADPKLKIKQKDNELNFFKIIPYQHKVSDIPQPEYDRIVPRKNETLSITFQQNIIDENDASNNENQKIVNALKIYFQFSKQPRTNWFFVHYPPFVNDFSIVIKIEKEKFESGALKIFTTLGYLKWQGQKGKGNMLHVEENPINPVQSVPNAIVEERMVDGVKECHICMEETGHFVLLHPCGHYNAHEKCILQKEKKDYLDELVGNYNCTMCNNNKPVTKFIHLRFAGKICNFCPKEENCTKFDSYYYPCGCSLGCYEGLMKKLARKELKLHCTKCNKIMEYFYKIYTS